MQNILSQIALIPFFSTPIIVGNVEYGMVISDQLKAINAKATILLESHSLNTATATAIAAQYALTIENDPLLLILPIDQAISVLSQFAKMLRAATKIATKGKLVVFGVKPDSASIDYGYIKKGAKLRQSSGYLVKQFNEKPNLKRATHFVKSGEYYWNSGIFLFLASAYLEELMLYSPRIFLASKKRMTKINNETILISRYSKKECPNLSIDKAVLEKTKLAAVFPFKGGWHDLGNWNSLYDIAKKDTEGNVITKNVESFETKNSYLYSTKQLLVTSGINNLLIVVTQDVVLVACRDNTDSIKRIVNYLINKKYKEATVCPIIYQSWGYYEFIEKFRHQKMKHFFINPKKIFSSKTNSAESTLWIVVEGKAQISMGKQMKVISKNESIEISSNIKFKVQNIMNVPLRFIEICNVSRGKG